MNRLKFPVVPNVVEMEVTVNGNYFAGVQFINDCLGIADTHSCIQKECTLTSDDQKEIDFLKVLRFAISFFHVNL